MADVKTTFAAESRISRMGRRRACLVLHDKPVLCWKSCLCGAKSQCNTGKNFYLLAVSVPKST